MAKATLEELTSRLDRLEAIQRLEAELLLLKLGPLRQSGENGPASMPTKKAAEYLGVSTSTLWKLVAEEKLAAPKGEPDSTLRLWPRKDLDLYLRNLPRSSPSKGEG